jgi:hypothetical protein
MGYWFLTADNNPLSTLPTSSTIANNLLASV